MTDDTDPDWAERYLRNRLSRGERDPTVPPTVPPEASEYMDDLETVGLSGVSGPERARHLETAVDALACALAGEETVVERNRHGRTASAYVQGDRVVVVVDGLGEVISVDRETASLIAFARDLDPRPVGGE